MSKSHRPLRAVVPCFNMAARTNHTSIIRERNERGFLNFLQNLKAVFHLFLTPGFEQLTTDPLQDARRYLLDAKGTLSRLASRRASVVRNQGLERDEKLPSNFVENSWSEKNN